MDHWQLSSSKFCHCFLIHQSHFRQYYKRADENDLWQVNNKHMFCSIWTMKIITTVELQILCLCIFLPNEKVRMKVRQKPHCHIETYQLVRNQFLLISLIMCHQHHQWNELVCLKQNQVCIHCPSCLEHFSSTKRGSKRKVEEVKVGRGVGSKRAGTAVKEETQGKQRLAEPESPPSLGYDWFFPCARMTKKQKQKFKMVL